MARVLNTFFSWMNLSVIETYDTNLVCDERLKTNVEGSTRLTYIGFLGGLEHQKIKTRLIDEMFASLLCEYLGSPSRLRLTFLESRAFQRDTPLSIFLRKKILS